MLQVVFMLSDNKDPADRNQVLTILFKLDSLQSIILNDSSEFWIKIILVGRLATNAQIIQAPSEVQKNRFARSTVEQRFRTGFFQNCRQEF